MSKKRTKRMEIALKVIQTWASMDGSPHNMQSREDAMKDIKEMAIKALRKGKHDK